MIRSTALKVITEPAAEPVTTAELKTHLRIDFTDDDTYIAALGVAARKWIEGVVNRAFITQTLELTMDCWPYGDTITLRRAPLQSVTSITYYDTADASAVFAASNYYVDTVSLEPRVVLGHNKTWPSTTLRPANGIVVRFVAGYGTAGSTVPGTYLHAIKFLVAHWYQNRTPVAIGTIVTDIPETMGALLWHDRVFSFA